MDTVDGGHHGDGAYILVAGTDLEFRAVKLTTAAPTGAQLSSAAGYNHSEKTTVLWLLLGGGTEDVGPEQTIPLGAERENFLVAQTDRLYRLLLNGHRFDWPDRTISGATLRKLGKVPVGNELLLQREDHTDRVVDDDTIINLDGGAIETFVTRKREWKLNVQGVTLVSDLPTIGVRDAISRAGFDADKGWFVFLKVQGEPKREVNLNEAIDLRAPGIERLRLTPRNVDNGEAISLCRKFALLDADEDHLDKLGLRWETIVEGERRWLILHDYPVPGGYKTKLTELAIDVPPAYPQAALYGFYAFPPLTLDSGNAIPSTQLRGTIRGREFHGWSRHRGAGDPWNPAKDNIATHLTLVDAALAKEVGA